MLSYSADGVERLPRGSCPDSAKTWSFYLSNARVPGIAFNWIAASGGYRSFEGLGGYSDLIQPAYAISLVAPWLILALKNRAR